MLSIFRVHLALKSAGSYLYRCRHSLGAIAPGAGVSQLFNILQCPMPGSKEVDSVCQGGGGGSTHYFCSW